ncbi:ubiquitin-like-conjugating enzyme ATG10 [Anoplopoma fimbria]|uniref:ubiquitin-like-conjugating enzyme ATG10 n=1 Tax=Anoplopoma fimbria TaxID=229290 RepID=UPI0023ED4273|nr:ubiquitin-like-conjugating enzyme ATG10 [Anoplopoma fimbria]XP_054452427.1 ubiquitin-like-conjugating enzyme ATG10 [Anoplopoma fimbria]XP_054452428.1 ubiquitin-like-conjugating enzyme ATG10 [Anoplopoma fimbria]
MSWCALDEENFRRCCQLLLQLSDRLRDGWSWEPVQGSEEGYLRKTSLRSVVLDPSPMWDHDGSGPDLEPSTPCQSCTDQRGREKEESGLVASVDTDSISADEDDDDDDDDEDDGVCTVSGGSSQLIQYEYHILHSCSYATPVLYFRAFTQEGRSLSLEEVWSSVHPNFRLRLESSPLNTITLQEHPLLGQPFFMLHPCRTEEFMRPVLQAAQDQHRPVNYVLSWLSVVGPVVGLDVPLKYSTLLCPADSPD